MNAADLAAGLAARWVGSYTRGLPVGVAQTRRDELASDLWEQRADASEADRSGISVAGSILQRMVGGALADLSWRAAQLTAMRERRPGGLDPRHEVTQSVAQTGRVWLRQRLRTVRCHACGERFARRLPNCPVCKTRRGHSDPDRPGGLDGPAPIW